MEAAEAVLTAVPITEFKRRCADDDLFVFQDFERHWITAQHVDVGYFRNRRCADAKIDQKRRAFGKVLACQYGAHRRQKFRFQLLSKWIATDKAVRFDSNVDDCRPGVISERLQWAVDVDG